MEVPAVGTPKLSGPNEGRKKDRKERGRKKKEKRKIKKIKKNKKE